jgi:hypothetical protein
MKIKEGSNQPLVCSFVVEGMPFELYATNIPTNQQAGYIHMVKELEILRREDSTFRKNIIDLKRKGVKTEPAFCLLLGLTGDDPYLELLELDIGHYYRH